MILFDFLLSKDRLNGRCLRYGQYQRLDEKGANSKLKGEGGRERLLIVEQSAIEDTYQASINSTFIKNEAFPNTSTYPSVSTTLKQSHGRVSSSPSVSTLSLKGLTPNTSESGSISLVGWSILLPLALLGLWALRKKQHLSTSNNSATENPSLSSTSKSGGGCSSLAVCGHVDDVLSESSCMELVSTNPYCENKKMALGNCQQDNLSQTSTFDYVSFNVQHSNKLCSNCSIVNVTI